MTTTMAFRNSKVKVPTFFTTRPAWHFITIFLLFVAWLLSLLVSISLPTISSLYLFDVDVNLSVDTKFLVDEAGNLLPGVAKSVAKAIGKVIGLIPGLGGKDDFADVTAGLRFGLWGYCFSGLGFDFLSHFDEHTHGSCQDTGFGLHVDPTLAKVLGINDALKLVNGARTAVLAFHLLICVLLFIVLLHAIFRLVAPVTFSRLPRLLQHTWFFLLFPVLLGIIPVAADSSVINAAGAGLRKITDNVVTVNRGPAYGIFVAAWALAVVALIMEFFMSRRQARRPSDERLPDSPQMAQTKL